MLLALINSSSLPAWLGVEGARGWRDRGTKTLTWRERERDRERTKLGGREVANPGGDQCSSGGSRLNIITGLCRRNSDK